MITLMQALLQRIARDDAIAIQRDSQELGAIATDPAGRVSVVHADGHITHGYGSASKGLVDLLLDDVRGDA